MEDLEYGPVELLLAGFTGDKPSAGVLDALAELAEAGTIRVIDLVHVTRDEDGVVSFVELDESGIDIGVVDLVAGGLASQEDVVELGARLPVGAAAVLLVIEHVWAKHLASQLLEADGFVVDSVRIPAPVVNLVAMAAADATIEEEVN